MSLWQIEKYYSDRAGTGGEEMSTKNVEVPGVKGGEDTFGIKYASTNEMWKAELGRADPTSADGWYGKISLLGSRIMATR